MEKLTALVASWTGQSPEEVKQAIETNPDALAETLQGFKVLPEDKFNEALTNRVKSLGEGDVDILPESIKRKMYANNKASALEATEKDLQAKYGTSFLQGKDYNNLLELVDKTIAVQVKAKPGEGMDEVKYKTALTEAQTDFQNKLKAQADEFATKERNMIVGGAIEALAPFIADKETADSKKGYIRYEFDRLYDLESQGDQRIVVDKATKKPVVDSLHAPLSVAQVMKQLAGGIVTLTETVPISGRGEQSEPGKQPASPKKYASDEEFIEKELKGKGINPFSTEGIKALRDYQKGEVAK